MSYIPPKLLEKKLTRFLEEDIDYGDITSDLVPNVLVRANIIAKQTGILCGLDFVKIILKFLDVGFKSLFKDGDNIRKGDVILELNGLSIKILVSERTILNLLMRLSGIATQTRKLVDKVKETNLDIIIASTRKTTPGFRYFEKYAVKTGGGDPHRWNLSDSVLIKENHLSLLGEESIQTILNLSKLKPSFTKKVDIEVESVSELKQSLRMSPEIIMLDDFSVSDIQTAIEIVEKNNKMKRPLIEISGGITEHNISDYFIPGVDIISVGSLTHSVTSIDFSLKIVGIQPSGEINSG